MAESPTREPGRTLILLILTGGGAIAAVAMAASMSLVLPGHSFLLDSHLLIASLAAATVSAIFELVRRVRRREFHVPKWFVVVAVVRLATLLAVLALLLAGLGSWLVESPNWPNFLGAISLLVVAFTLLTIWSLFAVQVQNLARRPSLPAPPPEARSPPPPP